MGSTNFVNAPELAEVAERLIPRHHSELREHGVVIEWDFRDDVPKRQGRDLLVEVTKKSGYDAHLFWKHRQQEEPATPEAPAEQSLADAEPCPHVNQEEDGTCLACGLNVTVPPAREEDKPKAPEFFTARVPRLIWARSDERGREALIDLALCQMSAAKDNAGRVILKKCHPDFVGYSDNIGRYGSWYPDAEEMWEALRTAGQLSLDLDAPRAVVEFAGMGELDEGSDGRIPQQFRGVCPMNEGHAYDLRTYERCPQCVTAIFRAEVDAFEEAMDESMPITDAQPPLQVVEGGAEPASDTGTPKQRRGRRTLGEWQQGTEPETFASAAAGAG